MNKIIIDSGSTKADIAVVSKYTTEYYTQEGINTQLLKNIPISDRLKKDIANASNIYYYGAGCDTQNDVDILTSAFKEYNVGIHISAKSDMLGACRATAGTNPGIVSILGTGSNSCVYDGSDIVDTIPQFGFIMNDEGGGSYIGKLILNDYFGGDMPQNLALAFQQEYNLDRDHILNNLYKAENPSQFLASHVKFMSLVKGKWKKKIFAKAFGDFVDKRISRYSDYEKHDLYFVGSVAFHFKKYLSKALNDQNLSITGVIQKPIEQLVQFHANHPKIEENE